MSYLRDKTNHNPSHRGDMKYSCVERSIMDRRIDIEALQKEVLEELGAKVKQEPEKEVIKDDEDEDFNAYDNVIEDDNNDDNESEDEDINEHDDALNEDDGDDEEIIPVQPPKQEKQDYAFKELREKNKSLESKISALDEIAQRYGFKSHDEMLKTLEEDSIKKEAQNQGIDPKFYKELKDTQKKLERMEREKQEEVKNLKLQTFLKELDSFSKELKLNETEKQSIIEKMDNDGYTIDMLLGIKNPRVIFKGYVEDKIVQNTEQRVIEKTAKKKRLEEQTYQGDNAGTVKRDMDSLADWAIKKFKQ